MAESERERHRDTNTVPLSLKFHFKVYLLLPILFSASVSVQRLLFSSSLILRKSESIFI